MYSRADVRLGEVCDSYNDPRSTAAGRREKLLAQHGFDEGRDDLDAPAEEATAVTGGPRAQRRKDA